MPLGPNDRNVMIDMTRIATGRITSRGNLTTPRVVEARQPSHNNAARSGHNQSGVRTMISIRRSMVSLNYFAWTARAISPHFARLAGFSVIDGLARYITTRLATPL
jgi:hypothetical protein